MKLPKRKMYQLFLLGSLFSGSWWFNLFRTEKNVLTISDLLMVEEQSIFLETSKGHFLLY